MVTELEETWSTEHAPRSIRLTAEPLQLHAEKALSLGVIVNELVSNACKYAYGPKEQGEIRVAFTQAGDKAFRLSVEDDGPGLEDGAEPNGTGLGSKLIAAMAKALSTTVQYDSNYAGVRAVVTANI